MASRMNWRHKSPHSAQSALQSFLLRFVQKKVITPQASSRAMDEVPVETPGNAVLASKTLVPWLEYFALLEPPLLYLKRCCASNHVRHDLLTAMCCEPSPCGYAPSQGSMTSLARIINLTRSYITVDEAVQILREFRGPRWQGREHVLWSGMDEKVALSWGEQHGCYTLRPSLGRLGPRTSDDCARERKPVDEWVGYMKGASALFAWCIAQEQPQVLILTPPPNERFHPEGSSTFQKVEGPILAGVFGTTLVRKVELCHPGLPAAAEKRYQLWPKDRSGCWISKFCDSPLRRDPWHRAVLGVTPSLGSRASGISTPLVLEGLEMTLAFVQTVWTKLSQAQLKKKKKNAKNTERKRRRERKARESQIISERLEGDSGADGVLSNAPTDRQLQQLPAMTISPKGKPAKNTARKAISAISSPLASLPITAESHQPAKTLHPATTQQVGKAPVATIIALKPPAVTIGSSGRNPCPSGRGEPCTKSPSGDSERTKLVSHPLEADESKTTARHGERMSKYLKIERKRIASEAQLSKKAQQDKVTANRSAGSTIPKAATAAMATSQAETSYNARAQPKNPSASSKAAVAAKSTTQAAQKPKQKKIPTAPVQATVSRPSPPAQVAVAKSQKKNKGKKAVPVPQLQIKQTQSQEKSHQAASQKAESGQSPQKKQKAAVIIISTAGAKNDKGNTNQRKPEAQKASKSAQTVTPSAKKGKNKNTIKAAMTAQTASKKGKTQKAAHRQPLAEKSQ